MELRQAFGASWRLKMLLKSIKAIALLLLLVMLVACGGDDGAFNPDSSSQAADNSPSGNQTPEGDTPEVISGSVSLLTSTPRIGTGISGIADITAIVKNDQGVLLEAVPVTFSANNNGTLQVIQGTTDESGIASAKLSTADDARNRTVTVSATAGSSTQSVDVEIRGTILAITGPSTVPLGETASYVVSLKDSEDKGISGQTVAVSLDLNTLSASTLNTDQNGNVLINLAAVNGGVETLTANAFGGTVTTAYELEISSDSFRFSTPEANTEIELNVPTPVTINWTEDGTAVSDGGAIDFSTTRGVLSQPTAMTTDGNATVMVQADNAGPAKITAITIGGLSTTLLVEFIATTPAAIETQAEPTQIGTGDQSEITVTVRDPNNNLVKNARITFELKDVSGGSLSTGAGITDSQGSTSTIYTAGQSTSASNGVEIKAFVTAAPTIEDTITLTVARQALRIALGTGNELNADTTTYRKPWVVIVTDASGSPILGANVELSLLPTGFIKGRYEPVDGKWVAREEIFCPAEDANLNGIKDPGEDKNGNDALDPTNPGSVPGSVTTGADGSFEFEVVYPQDRCSWVSVQLQAKIEVDGTEATDTSNFVLQCTVADLSSTNVAPPGNVIGLYGDTADCSTTQ